MHPLMEILLSLSLLFGGAISGVMCSNQFGQAKKVPKLFVFGDSYADTGNMDQSALSWKSPYGFTFPGKPSGRYSDGLIATDYLAKVLGAKSPYLYRTHRRTEQKLDRGMNFGYGESGLFSSQANPKPNISSQVGFLVRRDSHGQYIYSKEDISSSGVAVIIYSGKDYFDFITKHHSHDYIADAKELVEKVMYDITDHLLSFKFMKFKKVGVTSLIPIGCLPRFTSASSFKTCNESLSEIVNIHNLALKLHIDKYNDESIRHKNETRYFIIDFHHAFMTVLNNKGSKTRFKNPLKPCCEGDCGRVDAKGAKKYKVCDDPKSAFFWDNINPTQQGWKSVFSGLGNPFTKTNKS